MLDECIIKNSGYMLSDIEKITRTGFVNDIVEKYPTSLFKYFPNVTSKDFQGNDVNFSFQALKENTVYIQNPFNYNDPYDSSLYIDYDIFLMGRLNHYMQLANIQHSENDNIDDLTHKFSLALYTHIKNNQDSLESIEAFIKKGDNTEVDLRNKLFFKNVITYFLSHPSDEHIYHNAIYFALDEEFDAVQKDIYQFYKVSCFTISFDSMLMWSHYANQHKGFCIEYEVPPFDENSQEILLNLFPVIYSNYRSACTTEVLLEYSGTRTDDTNWGVYKNGLLRKSLNWKYEDEWRLILPAQYKEKDHCLNFFPIRRIYLGKRMSAKERKKIIDYCNANHIEYCGVNTYQNKYEMRICSRLCENCSSYLRAFETKTRLLEKPDICNALDLMLRVFNEHEAHDYSEQGNKTFNKLIEYNSIIDKMQTSQIKIWGAFIGDEIIGVIAMRNINHISLFFVDSNHQKQEIGKKLFVTAMTDVTTNKLNKITVNSSPYAISMYHSLGFIDTDIEQTVDGIRYTPMEYDLADFYSINW